MAPNEGNGIHVSAQFQVLGTHEILTEHVRHMDFCHLSVELTTAAQQAQTY
jgi:hypothetical protein